MTWKSDSNVSMIPFIEYIPGLGSVHAGALIPAVIRGFIWIDSIAYPHRNTGAGFCQGQNPLSKDINILEACFGSSGLKNNSVSLN